MTSPTCPFSSGFFSMPAISTYEKSEYFGGAADPSGCEDDNTGAGTLSGAGNLSHCEADAPAVSSTTHVFSAVLELDPCPKGPKGGPGCIRGVSGARLLGDEEDPGSGAAALAGVG